jgi:4'-phosphopantetheinyl transferase
MSPQPKEFEGIDLWTAFLNCGPEALAGYAAVLSAEERERAEAFRFSHLRDNYIAGRGILRHLLSTYIPVHPAELVFHCSPNGKPELVNDPGLHFNVSHSASLLVCAVTHIAPVGVDVEHVHRITDMAAISERHFSPEERPYVIGPNEFFQCWTRKEAFLKATGEGLSRSLDSFAVSIGSEDPVRFLRINKPDDDVHAWSLHSFQPAEGYIAAIAIRAQVERLSYKNWPEKEDYA